MRMQPPNPDTCSLAVGDASLLADADGTFDVPDVHVDRLVEMGWERRPVPNPGMVPLALEAMMLRPDAAAGSVLEDAPSDTADESAEDALTGDGAGEALPPIAGEAPVLTAINGVPLEEPLPIIDEEKEATYREALAAGYSDAEAREIAYGAEF